MMEKIKFKSVNLPKELGKLTLIEKQAIYDKLLVAYKCFTCAKCAGKTIENYCISCNSFQDVFAEILVSIERNSAGKTLIKLSKDNEYRIYEKKIVILNGKLFTRVCRKFSQSRLEVLAEMEVNIPISASGKISIPKELQGIDNNGILSIAISKLLQ